MWFGNKQTPPIVWVIKTTVLLSVVFFFAPIDALAQKRFSKTYPASQNVRLQLLNRSGSVTVEGWTRNEIQIIADLEKPAANIEPQNLSGTIVINLVRDNQGRGEVGSVNFLIRIPYTAMVDIETMIGNLSITSIRSGLVRAKITSEGDITLTNIGSSAVSAENITGDIFFDGEIQDGGTYRFSSNKGNINIRIPYESNFRLVATAPSSRNISLGTFANSSMNYVGNGRRVVGNFGSGAATISATNQQGNIAFLRR